MEGLIKTPSWLMLQVKNGYCFVVNNDLTGWRVMKEDEAVSAEHSGSVKILRCSYCEEPAKQMDNHHPIVQRYNMCVSCMSEHSNEDTKDD